MCVACDLRLSELSDDELMALASEVDQTLFTILKIETVRSKTLAVEERLSDGTTKAWKQSADKALTAALPKVGTSQAKVNAFLRSLGGKMKKPLTKAQQKWVRQRIDQMYKTAKRISAKAANVKATFSLVDTNAVKAIGQHQVLWIGDFYSEHLSTRIRGVSEEIMLKRGLSNREGGKALRAALKREFGITPGGKTSIAPQIPARFAGNPDLYFRGVASTAGHQSRTFGSMRAFSDAQIVRYEIINPNDSRTGQICFAPETPILRVDGNFSSICDIMVGDEVVTTKGYRARVVRKTKRMSGDWVRLGDELVTPNHEILTPRGWMLAGDIADAGGSDVFVVQSKFLNPKQEREVLQPEVLEEGIKGSHHILQGMRQSSSCLSVKVVQEQILQQGVSGEAQIVNGKQDVRPLQQSVPSKKVLCEAWPIPLLFKRMQVQGEEKGIYKVATDKDLREMRRDVSSEARGASYEEDAPLLFKSLPVCGRGDPYQELPTLREKIQTEYAERYVLLQGMLQQKQIGDCTRTESEARADTVGGGLRRRGPSGQVFDRLCDRQTSCNRGGRCLLAQATGQPTKINRDQKTGVETCKNRFEEPEQRFSFSPIGKATLGRILDANGRCSRDLDPYSSEVCKALFTARFLKAERVTGLYLPAHNLELAGSDPTYIAGVMAVHNCQRMAGQIFEVQVGVKHMERQLAAKNPKEIKDDIAPWHSGKKLDQIIGKAKRGSPLAAKRLAARGSALPPYHSLCRSEPVIVA